MGMLPDRAGGPTQFGYDLIERVGYRDDLGLAGLVLLKSSEEEAYVLTARWLSRLG